MSDLAAWLSEQLDDTEFQEPNPVEVMADVKAKRAIIANCLAWIEGEPENAWYDGGRPQDLAEETLRLLGSGYADRPGYLAEWKPRP